MDKVRGALIQLNNKPVSAAYLTYNPQFSFFVSGDSVSSEPSLSDTNYSRLAVLSHTYRCDVDIHAQIDRTLDYYEEQPNDTYN